MLLIEYLGACLFDSWTNYQSLPVQMGLLFVNNRNHT